MSWQKLAAALKGAFLTLRYRRVLDIQELFAGKRVAIVGPAGSLYDVANGALIDDYDYVVRINKALVKWPQGKEAYTGSRTDILFHSLFENMDTGGGPLDFDLYATYGVRYVVNPRNTLPGWRLAFNFYKKYLSRLPLYVLPIALYQQCVRQFGPLRPTIGYTALYAALMSPCKEVFITGFTFFRTPYAPDYREKLADMKANAAHIDAQGIHDPELELRLFIQSLREARAQRVVLDQQLRAIIEAE